MTTTSKHCYLIPAVVLGCLRDHWLTVIIFPGNGMVDGGIVCEYPMHDIPFTLRMPNTRLFLVQDYETRELLDALPVSARSDIAADDSFHFDWESGETLEQAIDRGVTQRNEARRQYAEERSNEVGRGKPWWRLW